MTFVAPYISNETGPFYFQKGKKYTITVPSFEGNLLPQGQSSNGNVYARTTVKCQRRNAVPAVYYNLFSYQSLEFDGSLWDWISVPNGQTVYVYEGVTLRSLLPRTIFNLTGDSFIANVAAGTALTNRPTTLIPYASRVKVYYSLALQGAVATATDLVSIALVNNLTSNIPLTPYCLGGQVAGEFEVHLAPDGSTLNLQYQNADTVAHTIAGSFYLSVIL